MFICNYCNNEFSTKIILNTHQKTAKYCILLQEKDNIPQISQLMCDICDKTFTRKSILKNHIISCKRKLNTKSIDELIDENTSLKQENIELKIKLSEINARLEERTNSSNEFKTLHSKREECIEKIALQPKTTTKTTSNTQTNILNNLPVFNLTKEKLQLIASTEFTHELFLRGQEGAAKFATNIARKENDGDLPWVVADKNRGIVKMKGEDGIIITDYDVEIITDLIFEAIKDKNQEYFDAAYPPYDSDAEELDPDEAERVEANKARADKCFSDIAKMKRNNKVFKKKLIEYSM